MRPLVGEKGLRRSIASLPHERSGRYPSFDRVYTVPTGHRTAWPEPRRQSEPRVQSEPKGTAIRVDQPSLLERVASGDERAVQECMDRYGGLVWSICRRLCRNVDDAEDAVQEVFIDLWSSAARFDSRVAAEQTFVAMIARRRVIDRWRKKRREPQIETLGAIHDPAAPITVDQIEIRDEASRVQQMMTRLRPEQQQVLDLSIFQGLSHSDISRQLDIPLGTIKTHARRGLMQVREMLGEDPHLGSRDEGVR